MNAAPLGWLGIVRLGLVQTALGAIFVLTDLHHQPRHGGGDGAAGLHPGPLMGWHYVMQGLRPRWGYGSDVGGRRTPWIIGGMAVLATGGMLAAVATALIETSFAGGIALAMECERDVSRGLRRHPGCGQGGQQAARAQHRHAADDPGRAPAADVRAVAPARAEHLHGVVQRHEQRPGIIAGSASSTTMTRLRVEVVSTTIAPSAVCTRPSRTMPSQPSGAAS